MLPLSFTFACLLNFDSIRSPIVPKIEIIEPITNQSINEIVGSASCLEMMIAAISENTHPPKKPSIVFLVIHFRIIYAYRSFFQQDMQSYHSPK